MEAAILTPVFFVLVFGVIELGLAAADQLALSSAVRAGSRTASASGNDPYADYGTVRAVLRESKALPRNQIEYIVVYRASGFGESPPAGCIDGSPQSTSTVRCNVYRASDWSLPKARWGCSNPATSPDRHWCPTTRKVTLSGAGSEFVGVWMKVRHPWVTKIFGNARTMTDGSVIRLEPRLK
jgi:hypothetical protein